MHKYYSSFYEAEKARRRKQIRNDTAAFIFGVVIFLTLVTTMLWMVQA